MQYDIKLTVNGIVYESRASASTTLLHFLRDNLHLTGTKEGCSIGECGACSVILDGRVVNACLVLAVEADGASVETIEGEVDGEKLSALQQAFVDHHALQCGFCTPGMVVAARDLLRRNPAPTDDDILDAIAGNLCRCTGYETVIAAIQQVARTSKQSR